MIPLAQGKKANTDRFEEETENENCDLEDIYTMTHSAENETDVT